jgi:hypothetical protein
MGLVPMLMLLAAMISFIVAKALRARSRGESYRFSALDGGMAFNGKSTSPTVMLGVAGAMCLPLAWGAWLLFHR